MYRVEIVINQALEEDLFELIKEREVPEMYTRLNGVHGVGTTDPKMGSAVWPEENALFIFYCEDEEIIKLKEIVQFLKKEHSKTGLQMFIIKGIEQV